MKTNKGFLLRSPALWCLQLPPNLTPQPLCRIQGEQARAYLPLSWVLPAIGTLLVLSPLSEQKGSLFLQNSNSNAVWKILWQLFHMVLLGHRREASNCLFEKVLSELTLKKALAGSCEVFMGRDIPFKGNSACIVSIEHHWRCVYEIILWYRYYWSHLAERETEAQRA